MGRSPAGCAAGSFNVDTYAHSYTEIAPSSAPAVYAALIRGS
jgi:hypothetical protein